MELMGQTPQIGQAGELGQARQMGMEVLVVEPVGPLGPGPGPGLGPRGGPLDHAGGMPREAGGEMGCVGAGGCHGMRCGSTEGGRTEDGRTEGGPVSLRPAGDKKDAPGYEDIVGGYGKRGGRGAADGPRGARRIGKEREEPVDDEYLKEGGGLIG